MLAQRASLDDYVKYCLIGCRAMVVCRAAVGRARRSPGKVDCKGEQWKPGYL